MRERTGKRRTIWVGMVVIIGPAALLFKPKFSLWYTSHSFNIIIEIMPKIKRVVHVDRRGWRSCDVGAEQEGPSRETVMVSDMRDV
jgi:hypothetical protein